MKFTITNNTPIDICYNLSSCVCVGGGGGGGPLSKGRFINEAPKPLIHKTYPEF